MVRWPSGLRRQTKDPPVFLACNLVRKGVGSNPTLIRSFFALSARMHIKRRYRREISSMDRRSPHVTGGLAVAHHSRASVADYADDADNSPRLVLSPCRCSINSEKAPRKLAFKPRRSYSQAQSRSPVARASLPRALAFLARQRRRQRSWIAFWVRPCLFFSLSSTS